MSTTHDMPLDAPPTRTSPASPVASARSPWPRAHILILLGLWLIIFFAAAFTPPLLDDADGYPRPGLPGHAPPPATGSPSTSTASATSKSLPSPTGSPPSASALRLPRIQHLARSQWDVDAAAFAVHFPLALTILGLALLGYAWARQPSPPPASTPPSTPASSSSPPPASSSSPASSSPTPSSPSSSPSPSTPSSAALGHPIHHTGHQYGCPRSRL